MSELTGVRLSPYDKLQYFDANGIALSAGDSVLVETDAGEREGVVAIAPSQLLHSDLRGDLNPVIRKIDAR